MDLVKVCFVFAVQKHAITIKNHSTTSKNTKEEGNKNTARARKVVFLLQVLIPIFNCKCKALQGGTLCGPLFCIFLKDVNKEKVFFEQGKVLDLVKVCFVFAVQKHAITIKNHSTTSKNTKEEGNKNTARARKVVFYCKCKFQFLIANARTCKGVPFVDLFFASFLKGFE